MEIPLRLNIFAISRLIESPVRGGVIDINFVESKARLREWAATLAFMAARSP
jgi:hypothetical protein